ncbi:MAG TPA: ribonuclease HII, partial [Candidatus Gracilibacteria bacterium]|nr:ribonuclease HII [Candidatus Gracilibacteria bacterium]
MEKDRLIWERKFWQLDCQRVLGLDEAGRGPLAGPVAIGGVIWPANCEVHPQIKDSKQLSAQARQELVDYIKTQSLAWEIVLISPKIIDKINILEAVKQGMRQIVQRLNPDALISDAVSLNIYNLPQIALVKGDDLSYSVAAASILAKTARDEYMLSMDHKYPQYGFAEHFGYPTKKHRLALEQKGVSPI